MDSNSMPLAVLYGIVRGTDRISFLGRNEEINLSVGEHLNDMLKILEWCNGHNTVAFIQRKVDIDPAVFQEILDDLSRCSIIRDSRELYLDFHADSANPMMFPRRISPHEVGLLVESRPVISGPNLPLAGFESALRNLAHARKSTRNFTAGPLDLSQISGLLSTMYGTGAARPTPSAGQLYPLDIRLAVMAEHDTIATGLYHYDPDQERLVENAGKMTSGLLARILNNEQLKEAALAIFIAGDLKRVATKYANRGYRYALIEAGHVAQNAALFCAEQNLGLLEYGGFQDELAAQTLGLDYPNEVVLLALLVGKINDNPQVEIDPINLAYKLHEELVGPDKPIEWIRSSELKHGGYRLPKISTGAKYRAPTAAAKKMVSDRDCFGFGLSASSDLSMIKAMAEAYERYACGLLKVDELAQASELETEWLDPRTITPLNSELVKKFGWMEFNPNHPWQWTQGYRHSTGNKVFVPVDHVFYPLAPDQLRRSLCYVSSSSGVAAHVDPAKAMQSAMLELVERDAISLTWYAKRSVTALPNDMIDADTRIRMNHWLKQGYQAKLLNLTTDSVPVVMAMIYSPDLYPSLVSGAAAGLNYSTAISKAWDEAETLLIAWRKRHLKKHRGPESVYSPLDHGKLYFQPENLHRVSWLIESPTKDPQPIPAVDLFEKFDPVVLDLTPKGIGTLKVVRLITEKLLPINFGYGNEHYGHRRFADLGLTWHQEVPSFPHFFA
jgi:thiazole/oxazole-forming peptide maturase SagD family component